MKPIFFLAILIIVFLLPGCCKLEFSPSPTKGKITEILNEEEQTIGKNIYDKNDLLIESWFEEDFYIPGEKAEYAYSYDSKNRLIQKTGYEPGIMYMSSMTGAMGKNVVYNYEYDNNDRIKKITINYDYKEYSNLNFTRFTTYEYPEKSKIIESVNSENSLTSSFISQNEYQFDSNGNINIALTFYKLTDSDLRIGTKTEFTYDNKNMVYSFEPIPASKNNILKKTITVYNYDEAGNQSIAYTSVFNYKYTYSNDNYPISQAETMPNQIVNIKYFKY